MKKIIFLSSMLSTLALITQTMNAQNSDIVSYKKNVVRFTPLRYADYGSGIGVGFEYERMLKSNVGLVLPFNAVFTPKSEWLNNNNGNESYYYFNPGIKFYPYGVKKVTYAVGPSLILGYGKGAETTTTWTPNGQQVTAYNNFKNLRMGLMVNNYLEINLVDNFTFLIDFGVGVRYVNNYYYDVGLDEIRGIGLTGNIGFSFGYRF